MPGRPSLRARIRSRWEAQPPLERGLGIAIIVVALVMIGLSVWSIAAAAAPSWVTTVADWLGWLAVGGIVLMFFLARRSA